MAIFHLTAKVISRGKGQSAVAAAAYRSRDCLADERTGDKHDYSRKAGELLFEGIYAPKDAPAWAHDRAQLWNHVEAIEKRRDAQLAREFEIALPHELTLEQKRFALQDWVRDNFTRKGLIADVVIHAPGKGGDDRNIHAHIMVVMRKLDGSEFAAKKERAADMGERKAELEQLRESWERTGNRHLERHGHAPTLDRRTLLEQGVDRTPTIHLGKDATALERKGIETELGDLNRAIGSLPVIDLAAERLRRQQRDETRAAAQPEPARPAEPERVVRPEERHPAYAHDPAAAAKERQGQEQPAASPQAEPRQRQPWHERPATKTEERIFHLQDAADRGGKPVAAALYAEGITLARVDADGRAQVQSVYQRQYDRARESGNEDARLRRATFADGELVAVNRYGDVHRLNPKYLDLDRLERAATGGADRTPSLSQAQAYFVTPREPQQSRDDRAAAKEAVREAQQTRRGFEQAAHIATGAARETVRNVKESSFKVMGAGGVTTSLSSFLEGLLGMGGGARAQPTDGYGQIIQQHRAAAALERMAESAERGEAFTAADIKNLLPVQLENMKRHGDDYVRQMIDDAERDRERERDTGRDRGR